MLRVLPVLLRMVLSLKYLRINNVKDVKPFPRIYHFSPVAPLLRFLIAFT